MTASIGDRRTAYQLEAEGGSKVTSGQMQRYSFAEAVRRRRATRGFLPTSLPEDVIRDVLEDAQLSPSNCNTQPWNTHVILGAKRDELSDALVRAYNDQRYSLDFSFDLADYFGRYSERQSELGKRYHDSLGVARDDREGRHAAGGRNLTFFGAPHVAMLFMPSFGDNVRVAADVGMYAQTFLLSLASRGLDAIPQTMLGMFADTVREVLGVSPEWKLLFGISFGYADADAPSNSFRMEKDPVSASVTFHR